VIVSLARGYFGMKLRKIMVDGYGWAYNRCLFAIFIPEFS
jgi:hypothetical protein